MISNANSEISPANNQIYNSQEIANLYEDFFRFYSKDTSESKEKSKEKFSEICKAFKTKCDSEKQVSLHLVLIEIEKNHEFAEFMINNLKILFSQDLDSKKLSDIFGTSRIIEEIIPPEDLDKDNPQIYDDYKYRVNSEKEEWIENFILKVKSESSTEQSSTPATYEENKKELLSIIDTTNPDSKKTKFPKFVKLLKECSLHEKEDPRIAKDNFVITKILENPDFLQDLNCFEIKEIVKIYKKLQSNHPIDLPNKTKLDDLKKLFKLAVHQAVKGSASFELINKEIALTEDDFDPTKLSDLKKQLNIAGVLDDEGLMKLFFTFKYFGEENNFISAIKPEKILQNPLTNYNIKFNDEELKHLSIIRTIHPKEPNKQRDFKEVQENFFKKLEEGDKHFCTTFYGSEFPNGSINLAKYPVDQGIVADWDLTNAGHFEGDFWSELFSFPRSRRFEGQDVSRLKEFGENRNLLTFALTRCTAIPVLLKYESNLNPYKTFKNKSEEYIFDSNETYSSKSDICRFFYYKNLTRSTRDQISNQNIFDLNGQAIMAGSRLLSSRQGFYSYSESNVYLNLSDINGLAVTGNDLNSFIDFFTETSLKRKEMLEKSDKLAHEIEKIKWQREVFCKDIEKNLEEKLKKLTADFSKLTNEVDCRCNRAKAEVLCRYSGAYFDFYPSSLLIDQDREFYDENGQILSHSERFKMINPQNISIHLQSLIEKTKTDLEYVKALSSTPDPEDVKKKLQRDLKIYYANCQETTLTKAILDHEIKINLLELFSSKDEKQSEKFKIFVQQLAFEGFYETDDNLDQAKQSKKSFLKKQIDFIAKNLGIDLEEQIRIGKEKVPFEFKVIPIKIDEKTRNLTLPLPTQLTMRESATESLQQTANFSGIEYQLNQDEIKKLLSAYRLQYSPNSPEDSIRLQYSPNSPEDSIDSLVSQRRYNKAFGLDNEGFDLELALNNAFTNLQSSIMRYNRACDKRKKIDEKGRDIHDGYHALSTSYYAKELLKLYQEKRDLFSAEMQTQIAEFDNPQKIKDLEILSVMHDTARTHGGFDQDEHKNAFYVALKLREMGDPRFQGDTISPEGLEMITDLANKEGPYEDKSLMSKLIQSADSLAILRCEEFRIGSYKYRFGMNEVYQDFAKIEDQSSREKELARLKVITHLLLENERRFKPPKFLEFSRNPFEKFSKDAKAQDASKIFKFEITHDQEGFNKLLKAGCVEYIQSNFDQEQINKFSAGSKSLSERFFTFFSPRDYNTFTSSSTSLSGALVNMRQFSSPNPNPSLRQASVETTQLTPQIASI